MSATDKELLELAAKAHGGLTYVEDMGWINEGTDGTRGAWWNPLDNDGDALRLSVKLRLMISWHESRDLRVIWWRNGIRDEVIEKWNEGHDSLACSRYAIVRAAAEIGRSME